MHVAILDEKIRWNGANMVLRIVEWCVLSLFERKRRCTRRTAGRKCCPGLVL